MRKIFLLQLFLVCFATQQLSSQVPGYRGKRFSAGYNASSFFYFAGFTLNDGASGVLESTRLSYKSELYVNYALSRKMNIGFSYYHGNQKNYFKDQNVDGYFVTPRVEAVHCKINAFELHFKFFKNNFVAPVGLYYQMGIGLVKYDLNEPGDTLALMDIYNSGRRVLTVKKPLDPFTCMKLSFHVGKTNPIGNYFYINTAIGMNFFTGGDFNFNFGDEGQYSSGSVNTYLLKNLNKGLMNHNMAEIKVGLGWLAF